MTDGSEIDLDMEVEDPPDSASRPEPDAIDEAMETYNSGNQSECFIELYLDK